MTSLIQFRDASLEMGRFTLNIGTIKTTPGITLITGPNGSGKSTLLRAILGLQRLSTGMRLARQGLRFGYLPQNYRDSLVPWLNGWRNLNLIGKVSHRDVRWLRNLGFQASDLRKYPTQLSGGQCQRLALLREWAARPDILILDEPFSGLDRRSTAEASRLLTHIAEEQRAVVLSTHVLVESFASSVVTQRFSIERPEDDRAVVIEVK